MSDILDNLGLILCDLAKVLVLNSDYSSIWF